MDEILFRLSQSVDSTVALAGMIIALVTFVMTHNKSAFTKILCNSIAVLLIMCSGVVWYADFTMANMREVPNVINQKKDDALKEVWDSDLTPVWVDPQEADPDDVLYAVSQEPAAFTIVPKGTEIQIVCSEHPVSKVTFVDSADDMTGDDSYTSDVDSEREETVTLTACSIAGNRVSGSYKFSNSSYMDLVCRGRILEQTGEYHWTDISDKIAFSREEGDFVFDVLETLPDGRYEFDISFYAEEYELNIEIYVTSENGVLKGESYETKYGFNNNYHAIDSGDLEEDGTIR